MRIGSWVRWGFRSCLIAYLIPNYNISNTLYIQVLLPKLLTCPYLWAACSRRRSRFGNRNQGQNELPGIPHIQQAAARAVWMKPSLSLRGWWDSRSRSRRYGEGAVHVERIKLTILVPTGHETNPQWIEYLGLPGWDWCVIGWDLKNLSGLTKNPYGSKVWRAVCVTD